MVFEVFPIYPNVTTLRSGAPCGLRGCKNRIGTLRFLTGGSKCHTKSGFRLFW